eukprot:RCo014424
MSKPVEHVLLLALCVATHVFGLVASPTCGLPDPMPDEFFYNGTGCNGNTSADACTGLHCAPGYSGTVSVGCSSSDGTFILSGCFRSKSKGGSKQWVVTVANLAIGLVAVLAMIFCVDPPCGERPDARVQEQGDLGGPQGAEEQPYPPEPAMLPTAVPSVHHDPLIERLPSHVCSLLASSTVLTDDLAEVRNGYCVVCFEGFAPEREVWTLPCRHQFHRDCIDIWLTYGNGCPMCRAVIS